MERSRPQPRLAATSDAAEIAQLLYDFNTEFETPTPAIGVVASRLDRLLRGASTIAILAGTPAVAVALLTFRPNVWYEGPVALLDELYVVPEWRNQGIGSAVLAFMLSECRARGVALIEINVDEGDVDAQRFYERHGYTSIEATTGERAFYYTREL